MTQTTPKIFVFSNHGAGPGAFYAMAEDGTLLGSHYCSGWRYAPADLGAEEGTRDDRREIYAAHYPDGFEIVLVPPEERDTHPGLLAMLEARKVDGDE